MQYNVEDIQEIRKEAKEALQALQLIGRPGIAATSYEVFIKVPRLLHLSQHHPHLAYDILFDVGRDKVITHRSADIFVVGAGTA